MCAAYLGVLNSCQNSSAPDVSHIEVNLSIERFDKFMFEKWDTGDLKNSIRDLRAAYPSFSEDFTKNILGLPGFDALVSDSAKSLSFSEMKRFMRLTKPLYDSLAIVFKNTHALEEELSQAFKYVRYYFPSYPVPRIITYVGPFDAPGIAVTSDALAIGLQLYAGKDFSFYNSAQGMYLYPAYLSRRFEPRYVAVNSMKAVTDDLFPDKTQGRPLIEQVIEKGKQWYLLDKFLPATPDSLKTGYTQQQLDWCEQHEGLIWNFLLQNDIYTTEPALVKTFIGEGPTTEGLPAIAPGNIGQWIGWKIVQKYASQNAGSGPASVMNTEAKKVFSLSKYKPRD